MRHNKYPRKIDRSGTPNNRRLSSARRALKKERDLAPLFAAEIAAEQPTPEERIQNLDAGAHAWLAERRNGIAESWRRARAELHTLSPELRFSIEAEWQYGHLPGSPEYLASLIHSRLRGDSRAEIVGKALDAWLAGSEPIHAHAGKRPK